MRTRCWASLDSSWERVQEVLAQRAPARKRVNHTFIAAHARTLQNAAFLPAETVSRWASPDTDSASAFLPATLLTT